MRRDRPVPRNGLMNDGQLVLAARCVYSEGEGAAPNGPPVTHDYAAMSFVTGGRSRFEQGSAWTVTTGDVLLIPAGAPHRILETQGMTSWGVAFCVPCLAADGASALLEPFERVRDGASAVVAIPASRHAHLENLFRELAGAAHQDDEPASRRAIERSLVTLVLAEVKRAAGAGDAPRGAGGVVTDALRFIERHCLGQLTVNDVADALDRSPTYITSALTEATGRSAGKWIAAGRMAEARRLLAHSDQRIDDIAWRIGYQDSTHFIRMFRREHGETPAAWRARRAHPTTG